MLNSSPLRFQHAVWGEETITACFYCNAFIWWQNISGAMSLHFHSKVERLLSCVNISAWSRVGEAATWVSVVLWAETLSFYIVATSQQLVLKSMSPDAWWDDTSWTRWAQHCLWCVSTNPSGTDPIRLSHFQGPPCVLTDFAMLLCYSRRTRVVSNVVDESVSLQRYRRTLLLTRWGCIHRGRHWWCNWSADRSYPQPWGRRERKDSRRQVQQKERLCF